MAFIIDDIALSPIKLTIWLAKKLKESAFNEMTDDSKVLEELLMLQMKLEMEEITEDDYTQKETLLMERLEEIRNLKKGENHGS
ncbi:MAG: gas vesicle protein GvpG [Proteobacteria bacterium]|nr:gas vesicle protein GvpG [Pseudomonadota bacterium]MBU1585168.1 gas vesicle protein GvpG [Pseudomonadota bacterium]MBU2454481.1 gas vesicle protein GvpG [Pseudomonadota bacterium]MBU2629058.1 gas vesicle protein GvpG [Pseudomonadota bacterium]